MLRSVELSRNVTRPILQRSASTVCCALGKHELKLKTGHLARFADAAVVASQGDSAVLATCVHKPSSQSSLSNETALLVDFRQSAAALGRIPTNFLRREFSQSDADILASRVIDRSLRPMISPGSSGSTQVLVKPMAIDDEGDSVILGLNAAACALHLSSVPLLNPVAGVRVAVVAGETLLNPERSLLKDATLDMVVTGTRQKRLVMLEMEGDQVPRQNLEAALDEGLTGVERILDEMDVLRQNIGRPKTTTTNIDENSELMNNIRDLAEERLEYVLSDGTHDKLSRDSEITRIESEILQHLSEEENAAHYYRKLVKQVLRKLILHSKIRCDGRGPTDFRPISIEVDVYKKLHGSALFQRGQTQVLSTVTFDSPAAAFHPDSVSQLLGAQQRKTFMLHYEFPAFATNEIGASRAANRREIGHGALAEKALKRVIPVNFPYTIRVSSQVLESNGSSSMASACSASLAMYDAGVPLKAPIGGVAMGIITDGADPDNKFQVLTDLVGIEDYAGDMDFKIAGSSTGFTAMQMDIKIPGISRSQLSAILAQGEQGLSFVLQRMASELAAPRSEFKESVPVLETIRVEPYKKALLFRNGGFLAKSLEAETGVRLSMDDDAHIALVAPDANKMQRAKETLRRVLQEAEVEEYNFGQLINAEVIEIADRGVFVRLRPNGRTYLVPNSQLSATPIKHPSAAGIKLGQKLVVQWLGRDPQNGHVRLSCRLSGSAASVISQLGKNK